MGKMVCVKDIYKNYTRGHQSIEILKGCSLEVEQGEFLVIMGPSGSGKSTLLNIIGGIDYTDSGVIEINNRNISKMNDKSLTLFRRDNIGIVFQFFNLMPTMTAIENIALPLLLKGIKYSEAICEAEKYLEKIHLTNKRDNKPEELSGGEMQRIAIVRAMINNPAVILADEPTGNLDSENARHILTLLKGLSKEMNQTILFVTHNDEMSNHGDRLIHLRDGALYS